MQSEYKIFPKFILSDDLTINSSIEDMKNKVVVTSSDEENDRVLVSIADENSIQVYGGLQEVLTVEEKDIAQAKNIAENFLTANNRIFSDTPLNILVLSDGNEIRANRYIGLSIISMGLNGWYNIKSASCTLADGQMKASLTLEW
jgi:hypothetical protein